MGVVDTLYFDMKYIKWEVMVNLAFWWNKLKIMTTNGIIIVSFIISLLYMRRKGEVVFVNIAPTCVVFRFSFLSTKLLIYRVLFSIRNICVYILYIRMYFSVYCCCSHIFFQFVLRDVTHFELLCVFFIAFIFQYIFMVYSLYFILMNEFKFVKIFWIVMQ
jgi:hypothetical protein